MRNSRSGGATPHLLLHGCLLDGCGSGRLPAALGAAHVHLVVLLRLQEATQGLGLRAQHRYRTQHEPHRCYSLLPAISIHMVTPSSRSCHAACYEARSGPHLSIQVILVVPWRRRVRPVVHAHAAVAGRAVHLHIHDAPLRSIIGHQVRFFVNHRRRPAHASLQHSWQCDQCHSQYPEQCSYQVPSSEHPMLVCSMQCHGATSSSRGVLVSDCHQTATCRHGSMCSV